LSAQTTPAFRPATRLRVGLFAALATALPLVVLVGAELLLQAFGVAESERTVFIEVDPAGQYLALNPEYVSRYFQKFVPGVPFTPFRSKKDDSIYRVFVVGGSSAAGFPYRFYNGFPGRLAQELRAARFPQKVEVVNLGMSAVNSYTVLDLGREALRWQPDALVVYAGHNEYYGAFGTGGNESSLGGSRWLKLAVMRLRRTVLYTLAEFLFDLARGSHSQNPETERTLMASVVRDSDIEWGGETFAAGVSQFGANMGALLKASREAGVKTYVGTLVSNLADQPPLSDRADANSAYQEGVILREDGQFSAAKTAFERARQSDGIRFRAPSELNMWLRGNVTALGATLVDLEADFTSKSPHGLEGSSLFTDHLHPNARGYLAMATAFREAMETLPPALSISADSSLDPLDESHARLLLLRLLGDYPFNKDADLEEVNATYIRVLNDAQRRSVADSVAVGVITGQIDYPAAQLKVSQLLLAQGDTLSAFRSYRALLEWQPLNEALEREVLQIGLGNQRLDAEADGLALLAAGRRGDKFSIDALGAIRLRQGKLDDASVILARSEQLDPHDPVMLFNQARLHVLRGDTLTARSYFSRYQAAAGTGGR
jgi:tetratricopeptide (TPR) repeat protein